MILRLFGAVLLIAVISWVADNVYGGGDDDEIPENDADVRERVLERQRQAGVR